MAWLFEERYLNIAEKIIRNGSTQSTRNGITYSLPNQTLKFDLTDGTFPLLTTRKSYYKGVLGEYAAMIRGPKHVDDFQKFGCNYWNNWADKEGNIKVDYGNSWINYEGVNQMEYVLDLLRNDPTSRRMVITGWRPNKLNDLDLPCCHHSYQFWSDGEVVDLLWVQRSGDWMVGVPSDAILASIMLLCFSSLAGLTARSIHMVIGDAHVYQEHVVPAKMQMRRVPWYPPNFELRKQRTVYSFVPEDLIISDYKPEEPIKYILKD